MKKTIILAVALLLAAVFMSGCVAESNDPVVGTWQADLMGGVTEDGTVLGHSFLVFKADGTTVMYVGMSDSLVSEKFTGTWKNLGNGKYEISTADLKGNTDVSSVMEMELKDGKLYSAAPGGFIEFIPADTADYVTGLWTGIRGDYNEYTDIQVMLYFAEDGTGNLAVYGPDVLNLEDVFTARFTWEAVDGKAVLTGEKGTVIELPEENGEFVFAALYPLHKYSIEDHLYGLWHSSEPIVYEGVTYDIVEIIKSDGTGVEIWTVPGSDIAAAKYTFTWKMTDSVSYEAVFDDGEVWEFTSINLQLFDGETRYDKVGFDVLGQYAEQKVTA